MNGINAFGGGLWEPDEPRPWDPDEDGCPECKGSVWRSSHRNSRGRTVVRYECEECGIFDEDGDLVESYQVQD